MKKVKIEIISKQGLEGQSEEIKQYFFGTLKKTENGFCLCYTETDNNVKTDTTLSISRDKTATIKRTGGNSSLLVITEGKETNCKYITAIGEIDLCLFGKTVNYLLSCSGGEINLRYDISQSKNIISENSVKIIIKEV
ncbi:MAG: DUF1934 domain-containing protein [Clostridia bacterium]|nr:DUF1934 domain-containing protein [Clostridia bacterium]